MKLEELKKLMPEGTSADDLKAKLKIINDDAKAQIDLEIKGLKDNQTKNLDQIKLLKGNQLPEGYDDKAYKKYKKEKEDFDKKKKDLDDKELESKGQWDALKLKLNETHSTALGELTTSKDGEISGLRGALDRSLIDNVSLKAIEKEEGNSFFLLPHMKNQINTFQNEDGSYEVQVINKDGKPRFGDDETTPFTVADLVAEMKANEVYSPAFPNANAGGGGNANAGSGGGSGGVNPWKKDTRNITNQAKLVKENPTLAAQFKKAAGVTQ